jgi:ParB family chromosome partitioning protein
MTSKAAAVPASDRELTAMERLLNLNRRAPEGAGAPADLEVRHIPLAQLSPNPTQPRQAFEDATIDELAESIRAQGVIQPLLVRPHPDEPDRFEIVVGERRFIAAGRAELDTVPCIVRKLDERDAFLLSVAENVAREDLNPIDEAAAYRRMLDDGYAANQGEIADLIGVHRTRVSRKLKLLSLDTRIQDHVRRQPLGAISLTHLEELSRLKPGDEQHLLYELAVERRFSTRELHARVEALLAPAANREPGISKSVIALDRGARIAVYPTKYTLRIPREPGDEVSLPRIVADLERLLAELRARLNGPEG